MAEKLKKEIDSFQELWKGGFYEGNPLSPIAKSTYGQIGFISTLYATYLRCIKPYINNQTIALEIGPGRGAWTKALLPSKEIYALDALSAKHNGFFEYLGNPKNVKYFQVEDFKCEDLPENHFNYMFSFGALCHVSFEGISEYAQNIFPKLKRGSNCFWMIADYQKYNNSITNLEEISIWNALSPTSKKYAPLKWLFAFLRKMDKIEQREEEANDEAIPGRWYDAGIDRTCSMLENCGYKIVDSDVETIHRDPIIHFVKP